MWPGSDMGRPHQAGRLFALSGCSVGSLGGVCRRRLASSVDWAA